MVVPFEHDTYPRQGDIRYQVISTSINQFYASYLDNPGALEIHTHIHRRLNNFKLELLLFYSYLEGAVNHIDIMILISVETPY